MNKFILALFASHEGEVDSLIVGAFISLIVGICISAYVVFIDHTQWNPLTYSTGMSGLLAILGGGKRLRDGPKPSPQDQGASDPNPIETK